MLFCTIMQFPMALTKVCTKYDRITVYSITRVCSGEPLESTCPFVAYGN